MPKKSFKVGEFILTCDDFYGIVIKKGKDRSTVRYFDEEPVSQDEYYGDTVQEFHNSDIDEMVERFLKIHNDN